MQLETRWLEWKAIIDTRWLCGGARCCKSETAPASCKFCKCLKCCKLEVTVSETANWRRRILRWPHRLSQGRLAHCDRLRDGRTTTGAHCSDAVCAFCAQAPTLHCPTVTGDNATSIGGGLASKHQNIFLFKSAPERWDTGIVRPICLDRAQILSHNALAHNARGSISHGVCLVSTHSFLSTFPSLLWSETLHKFGFNAFPVSSVLTSPSQSRFEGKMAKVTTLTFV